MTVKVVVAYLNLVFPPPTRSGFVAFFDYQLCKNWCRILIFSHQSCL